MSEEQEDRIKGAEGEPLSDPDHEETQVLQGTEFILRFYRLLKGASLYDRNNESIERMTEDCLQIINPWIIAERPFLLKIVGDNYYFNNLRLPVKADKFLIFKNFSREMIKRGIGKLEFSGEMQAETLKDFVFLLYGLEENNENNHLLVENHMALKGIQSIATGKLEFFKEEDRLVDDKDQKQQAKEVYFKSLNLVREIVEGIKNQRLINIRKAKHLMQDAVSSIKQDESALLGLACIKNYDEYTFNHSVNVSIYAIALGQRIGIPKKQLSDLGMAGLFHDIGKIRIPQEILNKTEKLSPEEWTVIRLHPVTGAAMVIQMKEWGELSTRLISGAFEHHLKYDLTGYPRLSRKKNLSLFGKIVAIADFYDALVRPRSYRKFLYVSEKILGFMLERAGKDFDPVLVKIFINMIGIFPLGTLVLLDTNEMGIVMETQEDPDLIDRPKVCLLYYSDGQYRKGKIVDLREMDEETKTFKKSIFKTLDPNEYNINVAEFVI